MNYIDSTHYSHNSNNLSNSIFFKQHLHQPTIKETTKTETISFDIDHSLLFLVKMTFIYSAVMDGWRVEKLTNNKFSFSKKNITKQITLQSFIDKHLHNHNLK